MKPKISRKQVLSGVAAVAITLLFVSVVLTQGVSSVQAQISPLPTPPGQWPQPTVVWPALPTPVPVLPTAVPQPTAQPAPAAQVLGYHTVRSGETLFCIGRAYSVWPWSIASQNSLIYPYSLQAGQVLAIPNVAWTNPSAGATCPAQFGDDPIQPTPGPVPPPHHGGCRATYTVRYGDTLYSIARRYGSTVWAIASASHIANINLIFAGQTLCIP